MNSASLIERLSTFGDRIVLANPSGTHSFVELYMACRSWGAWLDQHQVGSGEVISLEGEFQLTTIAVLLALAARRNIVVPLGRDAAPRHAKHLEIAQVERRLLVDDGRVQAVPVQANSAHPYYDELRQRESSGLVLFTSGSTGDSKAAVHDFERLLERYETPRPAWRTVLFLQLDHIGGLNTLLFTLAHGGAVIVPDERTPRSVCEAIARHKAELLPTSPTFLNLLLHSEEHRRHELSSLRLITYGTEPMPASTLARTAAAFPGVKLQQTYGMTEVGILKSQSRDNNSLWVRVGGAGYETRIADGRLWIRARSAMLGYLNAPSALDADGFLDTGDRVEVEGDWLRILGRDKETINVGGHKVFPAEVESTLLEMEGVADVAVRGEPHPLTGQIVAATVQLEGAETLADFKVRMRRFCRPRLPPYATPAKVALAEGPLHSERLKKRR